MKITRADIAWITLAVAGTALLLKGVIPMSLALIVANHLIDERGVQPGEDVIMAEWDAWAFSPQFIACAICGIALLIPVLWRRVARRSV